MGIEGLVKNRARDGEWFDEITRKSQLAKEGEEVLLQRQENAKSLALTFLALAAAQNG